MRRKSALWVSLVNIATTIFMSIIGVFKNNYHQYPPACILILIDASINFAVGLQILPACVIAILLFLKTCPDSRWPCPPAPWIYICDSALARRNLIVSFSILQRGAELSVFLSLKKLRNNSQYGVHPQPNTIYPSSLFFIRVPEMNCISTFNPHHNNIKPRLKLK